MRQDIEDKAHIDAARLYAKQLCRCKRLQVCVLFVRGKSILARGINGMPPGDSNDCEDPDGNSKNAVQHAEENAIVHAAREGIRLQGATVYSTHAPCERCAAKLVMLGVYRVVYAEEYRCNAGLEYLHQHGVVVEKCDL